MKRIHIIGGPGSGKTTLARQLATRFNVPAFDLDEVGYEGGSGPERPLEIRLAELERIMAQPGWITEGIFLGWTDILLQKADTIIWLDLPCRTARNRIIMRHFRTTLAGTNRHPGLRKLLNFLRWVRTYYIVETAPVSTVNKDSENNRVIVGQYLAAYSDRLVHLRQPSQVKDFLSNLS